MRKISGIERRIIMLRLLLMPCEKRAAYLKRKGIFACFGEKVKYASSIIPAEPYLVKIHNNVKIAADVKFITHDIIDGMLAECNDYKGEPFRFHMGTIEIFDNVMLGTQVLILPNIKIGPNAIVAAGAVVTKDVPGGVIVGGNPARIIGSFDDYAKKRMQAPFLATDNDSIEKIMSDYWGE